MDNVRRPSQAFTSKTVSVFHVNAFLSKEPQAPKTPTPHHNPAMETR